MPRGMDATWHTSSRRYTPPRGQKRTVETEKDPRILHNWYDSTSASTSCQPAGSSVCSPRRPRYLNPPLPPHAPAVDSNMQAITHMDRQPPLVSARGSKLLPELTAAAARAAQNGGRMWRE